MKEHMQNKLKSGNGKKVNNPQTVVAIVLSDARESGAKIPGKKILRPTLICLISPCSISTMRHQPSPSRLQMQHRVSRYRREQDSTHINQKTEEARPYHS